mmetsp:Transcript_2273/g.2673  ORF Transcript_2273/g.2673 Transcript_2273/m.2673 type:complete len:167 (-) Transcript_2273:72-572(-)
MKVLLLLSAVLVVSAETVINFHFAGMFDKMSEKDTPQIRPAKATFYSDTMCTPGNVMFESHNGCLEIDFEGGPEAPASSKLVCRMHEGVQQPGSADCTMPGCKGCREVEWATEDDDAQLDVCTSYAQTPRRSFASKRNKFMRAMRRGIMRRGMEPQGPRSSYFKCL